MCVLLPDAFAFHAKLVVPFYIRSDFDKKFRICKTALILQLLRTGMVGEKNRNNVVASLFDYDYGSILQHKHICKYNSY